MRSGLLRVGSVEGAPSLSTVDGSEAVGAAGGRAVAAALGAHMHALPGR